MGRVADLEATGVLTSPRASAMRDLAISVAYQLL